MSWLVALVLGAGHAWGADCSSPYALDSLADDLGAIEAGILSADSGVVSKGVALEKGLGCLDAVLPRVVVGRSYRALATAQGGDAAVWLRTAAAVDPGFQYTLEELPTEDHPAFAAWRDALEVTVPELKPIVGYVWAPGTYYLDGRRMSWPAAEAGMPHLLQRSLDGAVTTWRLDGDGLPADLLIADSAHVADVPQGSVKTQGKTSVKVEKAKAHNWPAERVAFVAGGGAALVGGGVLYGLALRERSRFDTATTGEQTERLARSTNTLTVASGATLAAGAGTLGFGVLFFIIDGDPRPTFDLRF